ncbi:hypothetical protein [Peredibacter starrii]|uniref:Uncharacterized protein n=1 Tax=Peredibacter starrii TaxID=28202 RepID=A0AAX4HQP2_9BACT|nr:hypothetical protein [Peredibacter starrii]WPU65370.1 hypothetical protein SOO65_01265 [Peredibacter starrii]
MKGLLALLTFATTLSAFAACPSIELPTQFKAREQWASLGVDMDLSANKTRLGEIEERVVRLTPTFDLYNIDGKKVAHARKKLFSWGTTIEVSDCEGNLIGKVKENILRSIWDFYTRYEILDANDNVIAATEKMEFFSTEFKVFTHKDKKKEEIMRMTRPMINVLVDNWNIKILKEGVIDPRILVMIPAFKTSSDNEQREKEEKKK